jgi:glutamate/tyrosine decarboxylase-like PLP-dependent enzyme
MAAESFREPLPETGRGAAATLQRLVDKGVQAATRSSGPRFFHFVTGGDTPAALAADWLASTLDQNAFSWVGSPLATELESVSVDWLKDLFELPRSWGGILTTGSTMAHVTALAAARHWWGERHDVDVEADGLSSLPPIPIFSSGYIHPSALKALGMLGAGRNRVRILSKDTRGRLDLEALKAGLRSLGGAPAIVVANAGEVNTGDFDPVAEMADLAEEFGAWLHVDGAFGLFARITPRAAALAEGVERAQSVISDGHKWLNVPYDCGFAFVADAGLLPRAFAASAAYLTRPDDPHPSFGHFGPEQSRRARALSVWATLHAYGRGGYRELVENHLDLAQHLARQVDAAPDLERLAEVPLNIVCFRFHPKGVGPEQLDDLNQRLGAEVLRDGRVYVGTTRFEGRVAFRPAIVNWRTTRADVELVVEVIRELGAKLARSGSSPQREDRTPVR